MYIGKPPTLLLRVCLILFNDYQVARMAAGERTAMSFALRAALILVIKSQANVTLVWQASMGTYVSKAVLMVATLPVTKPQANVTFVWMDFMETPVTTSVLRDAVTDVTKAMECVIPARQACFGNTVI